jgi:hypothetical protein
VREIFGFIAFFSLVGRAADEWHSELSSPIPQPNSPFPDDRQAFQFVYAQLALGKKDPDIMNQLVMRGMPNDRALSIIQNARMQRMNFFRLRGKRRIRNGSIAILIGIVITVGTLLAAAYGVTGGFYVVSFGPILFGLYYLALGLSDRMKH